MSILKTTIGLVMAVVLTACGGGGGEGSTPPTPTPAPVTASIASLLISAPSPQTLKADGTSSITLTVRALDASSGLVKGAVLTLTTTNKTILSESSVTTDSTTGLATVTLTADPSDQNLRTAIVSATCASCSATAATLEVVVTGATVTLSSNPDKTLIANGSAATLTAVVRNASGTVMDKVDVSFESTDETLVAFKTTSGTTRSLTVKTDPNGIATVAVQGLTDSKTKEVTVNVTALKSPTPHFYVVNPLAGSLTVLSEGKVLVPTPGVLEVMVTNTDKKLTLNATGTAKSISFTSTLGTFDTKSPVVPGTDIILKSTQAGVATVDIADDTGNKTTLLFAVSPPKEATNKLIFSANQTTLPLAAGTTSPTATLTVRALYSPPLSASDQAVANVPIVFSMTGGPGAGEYLNKASATTDSSGYATVEFHSGSSASIQNGILVSAAVQVAGVSVSTGVPPSSNSISLTVGGQALSVAIGAASVLRESTDHTLYIEDYSVQVTDANNNPVPNAIVTLRVIPVAFSLGSGCSIKESAPGSGIPATYCSEDVNGNGSLDAGEDGFRLLTTVSTAGKTCLNIKSNPDRVVSGNPDTLLTPQNSVAGSVPSTVTTDLTGTAPFSLTYLKASAIWVVDKISATVSVNGTESGTSTIFQLPVTTADVTLPGTCHIPDSPFSF